MGGVTKREDRKLWIVVTADFTGLTQQRGNWGNAGREKELFFGGFSCIKRGEQIEGRGKKLAADK